MQSVVFVVLAAVWLVAWFMVRRRVYRAILEQRVSVTVGVGMLGLLWALAPLFTLIWQPQLLPIVIAVSALVFLAFTGVTLFLLRAMGRGPWI